MDSVLIAQHAGPLTSRSLRQRQGTDSLCPDFKFVGGQYTLNFSKTKLTFLLLAFLTGCSVDKSLNDMKDKTDVLSENTKSLAETSAETRKDLQAMNTNLKEMKDSIDKSTDKSGKGLEAIGQGMAANELGLSRLNRNSSEFGNSLNKIYTLLGSTDARKVRQESLLGLFSSVPLFSLSPEMKVAAAKQYFLNFEFQEWRADGNQPREILETMAVTDFFKEVGSVFENIKEIKIDTKDQQEMSIVILATQMDALSSTQEQLHKTNPSIPLISMVDLLILGAKAKNDQTKKPEQRTLLEDKVLEFEAITTLLMKIRVNYFANIVLASLAQTENLKPKQLQAVQNNMQKALQAGQVLEGLGEKQFLDADLAEKFKIIILNGDSELAKTVKAFKQLKN
jgi:hypothetical protein